MTSILVHPSVKTHRRLVPSFVTGVFATQLPPFLSALTVLLLSAAFHTEATNPILTGDEPHYVIYAKSLGRAWGLDLQRAYEPENRESLLYVEDTHAARYAGPGGRFASWHSIGLPILLAPLAAVDAPAWLLRLVMIAVAAVLTYQLFLLVRSLTRAAPVVVGAGVTMVMLSPPAIYFSGQVYPELIAALLVVIALRCLSSERAPAVRFTGAAIAAAVLPWLAMRYVTLTIVLAVLIVGSAVRTLRALGHHDWRVWRPIAAQWLVWPLLALAVLGFGLVAFNLLLYGTVVPSPYFAANNYRLANLYAWAVGSFVGMPSGILPLAPILIVALVAIPRAATRIGVLATVAGTLLALAYIVVNGFFGSPGFSLPGRYLVTVVPLLAVPLTAALATSGRLAMSVVIVALSLTALSAVRSSQHYWDLYSSERRYIEPSFTMRALWPYIVDWRRHEWSQEIASIPYKVGTIETIDGAAYRVAREGRDAPGALAYGPWVDLYPGRYRATFDLILGEGGGRPTTVVLDVAQTVTPVAQSHVSVASSDLSRTVAALDFDTDGLGLLEFRVWFKGQGTVGLRHVSTQLLERKASEWWKGVAWIVGLSIVAIRWRQ